MDIYWQNGKLEKAGIKSTVGGPCKVCYGEKVVEFRTEADKSYNLNGDLKRIL